MEILQRIGVIFGDLWRSFVEAGLWKLLACAAVFLAALLLKGVISKCIFRFIKKKVGDANGRKSMLAAVLDAVDYPIQLLVITAALYICMSILGLVGSISGVMSKIEQSLIIAAVFWILLNITDHVKTAITKVNERSEIHLDSIAASYIATVLKCAVVIFGVLCVLNVWISDMAGLIAGISIGAVAVTLATQDIAANIVGSIAVMLDRPFDIGDHIEVGAVSGTVEGMGMRSTRIRNAERSLVIIPNKVISSSNIVNRSRADYHTLTLDIGVASPVPLEALRKLTAEIGEALRGHDEISMNDIAVYAVEFGENIVRICARFSVVGADTVRTAELRGELSANIMERAGKLGVTIKHIK